MNHNGFQKGSILADNLRFQIKKRYGGIARQVSRGRKMSCCSCGTCGDAASESPLYSAEDVAGLPEDAVAASLGCANPVALANLKRAKPCWTWAAAGALTC